MAELRQNGTSLILISHNMDVVRRVCDRGMVMYRGENIFQGTASEAVIAFSDAIREAARNTEVLTPGDHGKSERVMTFDAEVMSVKLTDENGTPVTTLHTGTIAKTIVEIVFHKNVSSPIFSFFVRTADGRIVYDTTTRWRKIPTPDFMAGDSCRVEFTFNISLLEGEYELGVDVGASGHYYDRVERALSFLVIAPEGMRGLVDLNADISFTKQPGGLSRLD
jgi:lipopolysaccharide transport system ATP-binding protein